MRPPARKGTIPVRVGSRFALMRVEQRLQRLEMMSRLCAIMDLSHHQRQTLTQNLRRKIYGPF